jgi:hypothetical protein
VMCKYFHWSLWCVCVCFIHIKVLRWSTTSWQEQKMPIGHGKKYHKDWMGMAEPLLSNHTHTHRHTLLTLSLTLTLTHTHSHTHTLSHICTLSLTYAHSLSHMHIHLHTIAIILFLTHIHTVYLSHSYSHIHIHTLTLDELSTVCLFANFPHRGRYLIKNGTGSLSFIIIFYLVIFWKKYRH